jgi:hypothetical protein
MTGGRGYKKIVRTLLATCLLALVVEVTIAGAALPPNVTGTFVRAKHQIACYPGEPCDQPPQAAYLLFTRNGHSTRAMLGAKGSFALHLAAGIYAVTVFPGRSSAISPSSIRVPRVGMIHPRLVQRTVSAPAPP